MESHIDVQRLLLRLLHEHLTREAACLPNTSVSAESITTALPQGKQLLGLSSLTHSQQYMVTSDHLRDPIS